MPPLRDIEVSAGTPGGRFIPSGLYREVGRPTPLKTMAQIRTSQAAPPPPPLPETPVPNGLDLLVQERWEMQAVPAPPSPTVSAAPRSLARDPLHHGVPAAPRTMEQIMPIYHDAIRDGRARV